MTHKKDNGRSKASRRKPKSAPKSKAKSNAKGASDAKAASKTKPKPRAKSKENPEDRSPEFDKIVLEHTDLMYAVALKLTRNPQDAQDLTQTAIVKALRFHDKFQEGTYIKAWLLTILRNTFINNYRRKTRRPTEVELSGREAAKPVSPEPEVQIDPGGSKYEDVYELLDDKVAEAIDALPEDFRRAVVMADIEDRSYKEIAKAMDCPIGTVMSRLYRGRKMLREALDDYARQQRIVT